MDDMEEKKQAGPEEPVNPPAPQSPPPSAGIDDLFGFQDAYGFRPEQPATGYNPPAPTPQMNYEAAKRKDTSKRILTVVLAVFLGVFLFVGGFFTHYLAMGPEANVLAWAIKTIDKHYMGDDIQGAKLTVQDYLDAMGKGLTGSNGVLDPYSDFLTPADVDAMIAEMQGNNKDYGFAATNQKDGQVVNYVFVHHIVMGSPAEQAGMMAEDIIVAINGMTVDLNDIQGTYYDPMNNVADGEEIPFVVKRPVYRNGGIEYDTLTLHIASRAYEAKYVKYEADLPGADADTAYLKYMQFEGKSGAEFASAMNQFRAAGKKNLILDLRNNGGGYLNICQELANYLITKDGAKVVMATSHFKDGKTETYRTTSGEYAGMGFEHIVVLVNGGTASASEVLLGAMLDYGTVSMVIGQQTYGKGIMQQTFSHRYRGKEYALRLTVAKWLTPNGRWIQKRKDADGTLIQGFTPDKVVAPSQTNYPYRYEGDAEIAAALEFLAAN